MLSSFLAFSSALPVFLAPCFCARVIVGLSCLEGGRGGWARTSLKKLVPWPTALASRTGSSTRGGAAGTFQRGTSDTMRAMSARQSRRNLAGIRASPARHKRMSSANSSCMRTRDCAASSL